MNSKIAAARLLLCKSHPYLTTAIMAMSVVKDKTGTLRTMCVDQYWRLYYNSDFVEQHSVQMLAGVLYHEVEHLLRAHYARLKMYPQHIANLAADAEINDDLRSEKVALPKGAIYPDTINAPEGLLAEQYARHLAAQDNKGRNPNSQMDSSSAGASSESESNSIGGASSDPTGKHKSSSAESNAKLPPADTCNPKASKEQPPMPANNSAHGKKESSSDNSNVAGEGNSPERQNAPQTSIPENGSAANGVSQPWELPKDDPNAPGYDGMERKVLHDQVMREIAKAAEIGTVPGHLKRMAGEHLQPPKVDWRRQLKSIMTRNTKAGMVNYSYSKISRRHVPGVILPGTYSPKVNVAVIADTSGSISDLSETVSEIVGIVSAGADVTVLPCDTEVKSVHKNVTSANAKNINYAGGGGTDMGNGIAEAMKLRPCPDIIVVVTDGMTPWGEKPPVPVIAVGVDNPSFNQTPKWVKVLQKEK